MADIGYKRRLLAKEVEFADLAKEVSDCSSAKRGGDLNMFGKGQMQGNQFPYKVPFEKAAYNSS